MTKGCALINSSVVVRKSILNQVGGISEDRSLIAAEDFDFWLRIALVTERFDYIPLSLGGYGMGSGNLTEVSEKQIERLNSLYNRNKVYLHNEDKIQAKAINSFNIGRIKEKMGLYDEALKLFKQTIVSATFKIKIKSILLILLIYIKRTTGHIWKTIKR